MTRFSVIALRFALHMKKAVESAGFGAEYIAARYCPDGYLWTDDVRPIGDLNQQAALDATGPWLVPSSSRVSIYYPMIIRSLHRTFASLDDSQEAIAAFASRYGMLGVPVTLAHTQLSGESLGRWRQSILSMGVTIAIYDLAVKRDVKSLRQVIKWPHKDRVEAHIAATRVGATYTFQDAKKSDRAGYTLLASRPRPNKNRGLLGEWETFDRVRPALFYVRSTLNDALAEHSAARVFGQNEILPSPKTLLGAMWCMFALEVAGKTTLSLCVVCDKWFEPNTRTRSRQRCCSNACRQKLHRQRRGGAQ